MRPCREVRGRVDLEGGEGLAGVADDGDASLDGAFMLRVRSVGVDKRERGRETQCVCASGRTDRAPSVFFSQS